MEETTVGFIRTGDLFTFALYLVFTLGLGLWAGIRTKTTEGYFLGGRKMPGWAVGISMLGTAISSMTFLAYPGSAYDGNFSRIVGNLAYPIGALIAVFIFVQFYREAGYISAYTYFERRFGLWSRVYVCLLYSVGQIWRMGLILYLLSMAVTSMHPGIDLYSVIILIGAFVTVYTVLGGIEAVIWTDVFQTVVLILGGVVVVLVVFMKVDGGAATVLSMGAANGKFSLVGHEATSAFDFSFARDTILMMWIGGLMASTQEFALDQTKIQRYCAASTARGAKLATLTGALGCIPLWFLFMFVGASLWVFYQIFPERMQHEMLADEVFPYFILRELPNGLGGVVIAGVMAAAMSSIDSCMSGMTTALTEDIYKRILFPGRKDSHYLRAAKLIATVSGIFMLVIGLGLTLMRQEAILEILFIVGSMLGGGLAGLFFIGFCTTRGNSFGAAIGIALALISTVGMVHIEAKALAWESRESWLIEGAVEEGTVDVEAIRAEIRAEAQSKGVKLKLADIQVAEKERIREVLAEKIQSKLGTAPPHLGQAIGIHPFAMGIIVNLISLVIGYFFSFLRPAKPIAEIGGLTWWTRHMKRLE
ncbi:MAG: sodium/solute symporter [bacterium]